MTRLWRVLFFLVLIPSGLYSQAALPEIKERVTDLTGTLTDSGIESISNRLASLEEKTGSQVLVVVIDSTKPETIEQYAIRLAEAAAPGRKNVNDGVLLLVAKKDRVVRIETGYGLEGAIPDATAKRIIEEKLLPAFRLDQFDAGIAAAVDEIALRIEEEMEERLREQSLRAELGRKTGIKISRDAVIWISFAICALATIILLLFRFNWTAFAAPALLSLEMYWLGSTDDKYFMGVVTQPLWIPIWLILYLVMRMLRSPFYQGGPGTGSYGSLTSGRSTSSVQSSSSSTSSRSSSSSSSSSSGSRSFNSGGGKFGGGGASGSW